jgi:hypothetical protein
MNNEELDRKTRERQNKIDEMVKEHKRKKEKERVAITRDENGNEYIHVDGEWIGTL